MCCGCSACCLCCDACSCRCMFMGRVSVSACKCCVFVSCVQPVTVRSAAFCMFWSFCVFVCDMIGDQMVFAYSSIGRVIVLYVVSNVSLDLPQCVEVSALMIFMVFLALSVVFCVCLEKVYLGSNVRPRILGSLLVGSCVLFI